jgi:DNA-binding NtrC family response regulator
MSGATLRRNRILLMHHQRDNGRALVELLRREGFEPIEAVDGRGALDLLRQGVPNGVLLELNGAGTDGLQVLSDIRRIDSHTPVILVAERGSAAAAQAVRQGAYDYLTRPFDGDKLVLTLRHALESRRLKQENSQLRAQTDGTLSLRELMGRSAALARTAADVERVAPTDFAVLIRGESGTGKELAARALHRLSRRARGPFVPVDCGALPLEQFESELFGQEPGGLDGVGRPQRGKLEAAAGGVLFLNEIQHLPLPVQIKLLRALQARRFTRLGGVKPIDFDVRVVAATNQDLMALAADNRFRLDLYHRLQEFEVHIPPLRERRDDILYLVNRFLELTREELNKDVRGISAEALQLLLKYHWPGNVRELRNVMLRAVLLAEETIESRHLALTTAAKDSRSIDLGKLKGNLSFKELVRQNLQRFEKEILEQALQETGGNKAKAARMLQIDYKTIHTKTKVYGLDRPARSE